MLEELFAAHESAPYDDAAAQATARLRHDLESRGLMVGPRDSQIAGLALSRGWTLVTANTTEFSRVAGLKLEDWTQPVSPAPNSAG
jgi:tRNA(fMet)-specific endonuclease VapC